MSAGTETTYLLEWAVALKIMILGIIFIWMVEIRPISERWRFP